MKNKMKPLLILMILFFAVITSSCRLNNYHRSIKFRNNSNEPIYIEYSFAYPNTQNPPDLGGALYNPYQHKIFPKEVNYNALYMEYWEGTFKNELDTLMVFVFDAKLLETPDTNVIDAIIQRYDLSFEDLKYVNWKLAYPPSPNMSAIKMYPPYQ